MQLCAIVLIFCKCSQFFYNCKFYVQTFLKWSTPRVIVVVLKRNATFVEFQTKIFHYTINICFWVKFLCSVWVLAPTSRRRKKTVNRSPQNMLIEMSNTTENTTLTQTIRVETWSISGVGCTLRKYLPCLNFSR